MRFKGSINKGFLIALALTLIPTAAISVQKIIPGSACKIYQQKVAYQNKIYTCIKSGKKLVWNKGVIDPTVTAKAAADAKAAAEKLAADAKAAAEKLAADAKATEAKAATDKLAAEKAIADKVAGDAKAAAEKAIADRVAADAKAAADKAIADKVAADAKAAADKTIADKVAADAKAAADKLTADKFAAEQAAATKLEADKVAVYRATLSPCPADGKCRVGNIGPGGGIVFYISPTPQPWGQYLEVAPATWAGGYFDPYTQWCSLGDTLLATSITDPDSIKRNSEAVGSGKVNTDLMLASCMRGVANLVRNYKGGGKTDWYLPSADEVNLMLKQNSVVGDFSVTSYWSSSLAPVYGSWQQLVYAGLNYTSDETNASSVRPIRAFG